jgi:hypothetical protein
MFIDGTQVADKAVDGILQRIDALAAKIGTTAQHIWDVYVAQAKVEGVRDLMIVGIMLTMAIVTGIGFKWFWFKAKKADSDIEDFFVFMAGFCVIAFIISVVCTFSFAYSAVGEFLNPQYWAFQHLTADLKNLF